MMKSVNFLNRINKFTKFINPLATKHTQQQITDKLLGLTVEPIIVVHGGAGEIAEHRFPGKLNGVKNSVRDGHKILVNGGSALDAVEAAVRSMERDGNFNAGYGAVLNSEGNIELEGSIMNGENLKVGCVTLITDIRHPISVARRVLEKTNHTFLGGRRAMAFAREHKFEILPEGSLVSANVKIGLDDYRDQQNIELKAIGNSKNSQLVQYFEPSEPGTVGAVAIDINGNIAAATSTGGVTDKCPGRIGDVPLLCCGTYADNLVGGVATSGHGESIMRYNLAQKILERLRYKDNSEAQEATDFAIIEMTERLYGTGGAITIDKMGRIGIYWSSQNMAWAFYKGPYLHYGIRHCENFQEEI